MKQTKLTERLAHCTKHVNPVNPKEPGSAARAVGGESKLDGLESSSTTATYEVRRGRVPAKALFAQEAQLAKKKGHRSVKVLTSGPQALVDGVLVEARAVDWQLFDTEEFSFEF